MTVAGTVLLMGVEILAMFVLCQTIAPGAPVIAGPFPFMTDMATGNSLNSSVEVALTTAAAVQFLKKALGLPTNTYGFGTDSPVTDGQAALETTLKNLVVSTAGSDLVSGAGMINSINAFSLLQLVMDDHLVKMVRRVNRGVRVDAETLAVDEILSTRPGDHFLERSHTLKHCREALRSDLLVSQSWEDWKAAGAKDLYARARERYRQIKANLQPTELPGHVQRELDRIIKRADDHLAR